MAISSELRRSARYVGDGSQAAFPFGFKIFAGDQIKVVVADTSGDERELTLSEFSVALSPDQDNAPGGSVTLTSALPVGHVLVVLSAVPALQPTVFTNRGGFYPETLNESLDRLTIIAQQLKEKIDRTLVVPVTSSKSPEQVFDELLDASDTASAYAQEVRRMYDEIVAIDETVEQNAQTIAELKDSIETSERNVTALADQVNEYADELTLLADNYDVIHSVGIYGDVLATIATDLKGEPIHSFDGGEIGEPDEPMNGVTGGVMKHCSDNMDAIRRVAELLDSGVDIGRVVDLVDEIGSTDYVAINRTGVTGA